jgi:adenylate cyclase
MLRAERQRVTLLAIALAAFLVLNLTFFIFFRDRFDLAYRNTGFGYWVFVAQLLAIGYELIARTALGRFIAWNKEPPTFARYMNALIETNFATVFLLILVKFQGPADALQRNVFLFYTLFIVLSTLRLDFGLCVWTGLIAAAEYFGVWLWYRQTSPALMEPYFVNSVIQRSVFF